MFCGDCRRYITRPNGEDFCAKTGKVVPYLAERECFEARGNNTNTNTNTMEENTKQQTKVCTVCGRELPIDSFPVHPTSKDGHTSTCKECHKKRQSEGQRRSKGAEQAAQKPRNCDGYEYQGFKKEGLAAYEDAQLVGELRARGYDVKCTKTIEL